MTIVEAAIATLIVGGVLVAAMNSVAASRTIRGRVADRVRAQQLALDLISEIMQQGFSDPGTPPSSRAAWAYVSDYNGLVDSPPQTRSGTPIPDVTSWKRTVTIQWANPTTFAATSSTNTGVYLITVTVTRGTLVLASASALRTSAWVSSGTPVSSSAPIASATASPLTGSGGNLTVNFSGARSTDPTGNALSYAWNFGDGSSGSGASVSHTYTAIGTYAATLTVSDGQGGFGVSSVNIVVTP
jgi:PKD repeat protein